MEIYGNSMRKRVKEVTGLDGVGGKSEVTEVRSLLVLRTDWSYLIVLLVGRVGAGMTKSLILHSCFRIYYVSYIGPICLIKISLRKSLALFEFPFPQQS